MSDAWITQRYTLLDDGTAIRCERCNLVSHNIDDVRQRYCGNCKRFHDDDQIPLPPHIKAIAESIAMEARAIICQGREVQCEIFVLNTTKQLVVQPKMQMGEIASSDAMAQETRLLADEIDADAVILLSEAWQQAMKGSAAERAAQRAQHVSIADMPGSREILLLTIETADHYWSGRAFITGAGLDRRCGEVVYESPDAERGRFTNFLLSPAAKAKIDALMDTMRVMLGDLKVDPETLVEHEGARRRLLDVARRVVVRHGGRFETDPIRVGMAVAFLARLAHRPK